MKIAVVGAGGRMGRTIIAAILKDDALKLVAAIDQPGTPLLGRDAGESLGMSCGVLLSSELEAGIGQADCLIDFTSPASALAHLELCVRYKVAIVIGMFSFGIITELTGTQRNAVLALMVFFILSLIFLLFTRWALKNKK